MQLLVLLLAIIGLLISIAGFGLYFLSHGHADTVYLGCAGLAVAVVSWFAFLSISKQNRMRKKH